MCLRIRIVAATLVAAGPVLTGACSAGDQPSLPSTPDRIRFGYLVADLHHMSHIVARDPEAGGGSSLYQQYALEVVDALGAPYANGGVEMDHFAAGDVDVGMMGAPPAITKHLNAGINTVIVGQVNEIGSALVVSEGVASMADLAGKTVATPSHASIQFFLLLNYAQQQGVDVSQLTIVDMAPKDMRAKLEVGDLGGFLVWEPFASEATVTGFGRILATSQDIWPNHLDCVVVADRSFAGENPDTVVRYLQAHSAATDWMLSALADPDSDAYRRLIELAVEFTGRDPEVVQQAFSRIQFKTALDSGFSSSLRDYTNKLIEFNIVAPDSLPARGYISVDDFVSRYVDGSYQGQRPGG
jgi:ABC-type nitrate/sulfonate/bicarbonate transport system substrate-binding protein